MPDLTTDLTCKSFGSDKFDEAIDYRLSSSEWSADIAKRVTTRHRRNVVTRLSVLGFVAVMLLGTLSFGSVAFMKTQQTGYAELSQYLYADVGYDYDEFDLLK